MEIDSINNIKLSLTVDGNIKIHDHSNDVLLNYSIVQLFLDCSKDLIEGHNSGNILVEQVRELKEETEGLSKIISNLYDYLSNDLDEALEKIDNGEFLTCLESNLTFENFLNFHIQNNKKKYVYAIVKLKKKVIIKIYHNYNELVKTLIYLVNKKLKYVDIKIDNTISFDNLVNTFNEIFENNLILLKIDKSGKGYILKNEKNDNNKKS